MAASNNNLYKIRTNLIGHTQDVRCLACLPDSSIVSGSRDCTCQLWNPEVDSINYSSTLKYTGHENFVSCVTIQPGYIITGCNDKKIRVFENGGERPLYELEGHSENVCTITACHDGKILSGSWDKTGRVWLNQKCIFVLSGHEYAIWAVAICDDNETMITGIFFLKINLSTCDCSLQKVRQTKLYAFGTMGLVYKHYEVILV